jgi:hypothetical protein
MPTSEAPSSVTEPAEKASAENGSKLVSLRLETAWAERPASDDEAGSETEENPSSPVVRGSRWLDYDTHELLEMIDELEDERRWSRLREGIWLALLLHIILISAITWIPRYVFHVAPVIDPFDAIKQRKDLTYLDLPPDALQQFKPKVQVKPTPPKPPQIDKKTLEAMNKETAPPLPAPAPEPKVQLAQPAPVQPTPQIAPQLEAPAPRAVPARPSFAMGSQNPANQLRDAMRASSRDSGSSTGQLASGGLPRHPGAGSGGVQILSDRQGVDFNNWLIRWHRETENTWDPLIPDEVNPPIGKSGVVVIRFKVLPNGRLMDGSVILEGRSGDTALDRAAWGALTGSNYPPLPSEFHGPYLELRAMFMYNIEPK